jgi:hypothetical protein
LLCNNSKKYRDPFRSGAHFKKQEMHKMEGSSQHVLAEASRAQTEQQQFPSQDSGASGRDVIVAGAAATGVLSYATTKPTGAEAGEDNGVLDAMSCCVCYEIEFKSQPRIYQCKNGHVLCNDCIPKLQATPAAAAAAATAAAEPTCPVCVVHLGGRRHGDPAFQLHGMARNRVAEAMLKGSKRGTCPGRCNQSLPTLLLGQHHDPSECAAVERKWNCILGGCSGPSEFKHEAGLVDHIVQEHDACDCRSGIGTCFDLQMEKWGPGRCATMCMLPFANNASMVFVECSALPDRVLTCRILALSQSTTEGRFTISILVGKCMLAKVFAVTPFAWRRDLLFCEPMLEVPIPWAESEPRLITVRVSWRSS